MKLSKRHSTLPIGRSAGLAFEIDNVRAECSKAAQVIISQKRLDEFELEECALLDDALAHSQRLLKAAVRNVLLSRLKRRSRRSRTR